MTRTSPWPTLVCSLVALSQIAFAEHSTRPDISIADEQEIYAVVIRSQMERWIRSAEEGEAAAKEEWQKSTARSMNFRVFFVSIKGKDPSDSFLLRLHDIPRKTENSPALDTASLERRSTKQHFKQESFSLSSPSAGPTAMRPRCGARILFRVQRKSSKWVVNSFEMEGSL